MKTIANLLLATLFVAVFGLTETPAQSATGTEIWSPVGPRGISPHWTYNPELEFDTDGKPVVAYIDPTTDKPTVKMFDGTQWSALGTESFTLMEAGSISFSITPAGSIYLAMVMDDSIAVRQWNGSSWASVGGTYASPGGGAKPVLECSPSGTLYLAFMDYYDLSHWGDPRVMMYDGSWTPIGYPGFSDIMPYKIDLAFVGGQIYFGAKEGNWGDKHIGVYTYDGQGWSTLDDPVLDGDHYNFSLEGTSGGELFLAYRDGDQDSKLTVREWSGGSWTSLGSPGMGDDYVFQLDMSMTPLGYPIVAVVEGNVEELCVYEYINGSWTDRTPAPLNGQAAFYGSGVDLEFSDPGYAHVAIQDDWALHAVSVFINAGSISVPEWQPDKAFGLWPNPTTGQFYLQWNEGTNPVTCRVYDTSGRIMAEGESMPRQQTEVGLSGCRSGVYYVESVSGRSREVRRIIIAP